MKLHKFAIAVSTAALLAACGGSTDTPTDTAQTPAGDMNATTSAQGGDIRIVGSSTVYPFSTKVAQEFKNKTGYNVVVESTGSGGGHKLFCAGPGLDTPDITNSSRRQKKSEFELCLNNGVEGIIEVPIGFDGIVVSNAIDSANIDMSLREIYMAFAKMVPTSDTDCTMIPNPAVKWTDINPNLPDYTIEAYGPPPTSGTRDAFVEIAMEGGAKEVSCLAELSKTDEKAFGTIAHTVREDGKWIDSGENDNALVQTLINTPTAVGVFGYSFLAQNEDKVKGAKVGGVPPLFENIASGEYAVSRSLYIYVKKGHIGKTPGLQEFTLEFLSDAAAGDGGYLEEIGLVPMPEDRRQQVLANIQNMTEYSQ